VGKIHFTRYRPRDAGGRERRQRQQKAENRALKALGRRAQALAASRARATAWGRARDIEALVAWLAQLRAPLAGAHAFHALIELADAQGTGLAALLETSLE
jgi:hypothetical protein